MEHVKRMNALFAACDKDNTGTLTDDEVRDFLIQMNSAMGEDDLLNFEIESAFKFILSAADTDNDNALSLAELFPALDAFQNWTLVTHGMHEQVKKLLKKYDEEHSGSLDKRELGLLLKELNGDLIVDEKVLEEIWSSTDVNHDGSVDLQELAPALSKWDTSHDGAFDHEDDPNIQIRHLPTSAPKYVVRVGSHNYGSAKGEEFHIKGGSIGGGGGKGCCIVQ